MPQENVLLDNYQEEISNLEASYPGGSKVVDQSDQELNCKIQQKSKKIAIKSLQELHIGDYVVHMDYGLGEFSGMHQMKINGGVQEIIRILYRDNDLINLNICNLSKLSKYTYIDKAPVLDKLSSSNWKNKKKRIKDKVNEMAKDLIHLYSKRKEAKGFAFSPDTALQKKLEESFIHQDTIDQVNVMKIVKQDMESSMPMDRLICGDVGFGKTEIAMRAAFKAVQDQKQVAVLAPTTILTLQHFHTFTKRMKDFKVKIDYLNRFKKLFEAKETIQKVTEGKIDILIGTHTLILKEINFKNLGLLIVDEEQKFGVKIKEKLKKIKINLDVLTLTATPIPRTLHFSLMGARDISIMTTPPKYRKPIHTQTISFDSNIIRRVIQNELDRNGQVFFINNQLQTLPKINRFLDRILPEVKKQIVHGQMKGQEIEKIMMDFVNHQYDILISTNIIESGVNIPNVNTIIINSAEMFGLSDLHQIRGRVGRTDKQSYCYLVTQSIESLTQKARQRLQTFAELSNLGDGFQVAMNDLDNRGAGTILNTEQSGFIADIGLEAYHKIVNDTVIEIKKNQNLLEEDHKNIWNPYKKYSLYNNNQDCVVETPFDLIIPVDYIKSANERLHYYLLINKIQSEEEIVKIQEELESRFGSLPQEVWNLLEVERLKKIAIVLEITKIIFKEGNAECFFTVKKENKHFRQYILPKLLTYIQKHSKDCQLTNTRDDKTYLIIQKIDSILKLKIKLKEILNIK